MGGGGVAVDGCAGVRVSECGGGGARNDVERKLTFIYCVNKRTHKKVLNA